MPHKDVRRVLITGGAGFIGSNLAERLLSYPNVQVRIFDNLSRAGVIHNLEWLRTQPGANRLQFVRGDVRDPRAVAQAARDITEIYHLAAQVAVTTSVVDPVGDFQVNANGTLNVLEAARKSGENPFVLFTSTNKVYGALPDLPISIEGTHYRAAQPNFRGIPEEQSLDFHSPYGCSKGAADQYVRDYSRIYDLPAVVFRMSCIAGPRQMGNEDQGWVAHFLYSALSRQPITIYGDGYQVRDILHVYDLIDAMQAVYHHRASTQGQVFNLGGGVDRAASVIEMLTRISELTGQPLNLHYTAVRPGDQPLYIADTTKLRTATGWTPKRSLQDTLCAIWEFWKSTRHRVPADSAPALQEEVA
ncbi:NAD-dependent epimerase/dehydratase family protein [Acidobacteria bacterium AB60]|nr:NAD-dependent epimerase/dehydratase family protein [Acidobacteria bacterium AB60]